MENKIVTVSIIGLGGRRISFVRRQVSANRKI